MTIFIHYSEHPRPDMPASAKLLGEITIQHMTRTKNEYWFSDDHKTDRAAFNAAKQRAAAYSKKTMPPCWM